MSEDWRPYFGLTRNSDISNEELAVALNEVRKRVCAYGGKDPCDCKRGLGEAFLDGKTYISSEKTGCYELRHLIYRLTETLF